MRYPKLIAQLLGVCVAAALVASCATSGGTAAPGSRAEAKAQRDAFLATHDYDDALDMWVPKPGTAEAAAAAAAKPSETRAEAKQQRDVFLAKNKYDDECACFKPIEGAPRDVSAMSRQDVKAELKEFMRTHEFDDATSTWVAKPTK